MFNLWIIAQTGVTGEIGAGKLVDTGLTINPYGLTVYGALVVVLAFIAFRLYIDLKQERQASRELADNAMVLMTKLEDRLPSVRQFADIETTLQRIEEGIKQIKQHP